MNEQRIQWIDSARGIGILLVVIGHVSKSPYLGKFIYSFHMPLFFIISGYLYNNKKYAQKAYIKRKAENILVPYFIFGICSLVYWILIERNIRNQTEKLPIWQFVNMFLCFGGDENYIYNAPLWFLPALLNTEIICSFLFKLKEKNIKIIAFIISIIGVIFSKCIAIRLPFCIDIVMVTIPFYVFGYYLKQKDAIKLFRLKEK